MKTKKALCIGIAEYSFADKLKNPINDANDVSTKLLSLGYETTVVKNPTRVEFLREVRLFEQGLIDAEVSVIFYAGHGIQSKGINYLIPIDANPKSEQELDIFCIKLDDIINQETVNLEKVNLLILDACRNNPFERTWSRGMNLVGFAPVLAPSGTLISFSTSPQNTASDGSGNNGLFTEAFLTEISKPDLSIIQVFQNVRQKVLFASNNNQLPWESTSLLGDFFFNPKSFNPTDIRIIQIRKQVALIEQNLHKYKKSEISAMEESTEGGVIFIYNDHGTNVKIEKQIFGEGGRWFQDIYLNDNFPFFYRISNHSYNVPFYIEKEDAEEMGIQAFDENKTRIDIEEYFIEEYNVIGHNIVSENDSIDDSFQLDNTILKEIDKVLKQVKIS